jgi:hypothetical protein
MERFQDKAFKKRVMKKLLNALFSSVSEHYVNDWSRRGKQQ